MKQDSIDCRDTTAVDFFSVERSSFSQINIFVSVIFPFLELEIMFSRLNSSFFECKYV